MANNLIVTNQERPRPNWDELVPQLFINRRRFLQTGRRRWQIGLDGLWAGIAVALRPPNANFGLNQEDIERLIEKTRDGSLAAGFAMLAAIQDSQITYIAHREVEAVYANLKDVLPRGGPFGPYWLLREDFTEVDDLAEARKRF
jgi:hypothetical protein